MGRQSAGERASDTTAAWVPNDAGREEGAERAAEWDQGVDQEEEES